MTQRVRGPVRPKPVNKVREDAFPARRPAGPEEQPRADSREVIGPVIKGMIPQDAFPALIRLDAQADDILQILSGKVIKAIINIDLCMSCDILMWKY